MKRLLPRTQQRQLSLLRSNPSEVDDGNDDGYDDTDLHVAYRRPGLVPCDNTCDHEDDGLSDHVKFRLWLARQLALRAYEKAQA